MCNTVVKSILLVSVASPSGREEYGTKTCAKEKIMRIELSWPPKELSPNQKNGKHWGSHQKAKEAARNEGFYAVKAIAPSVIPDKPCLDVSFYPPSARRYDLDGLLGRIKYHIDGIAMALGVDDYNFSYKIKRCEPIKGGKVVIEIKKSENNC